MSLLGSALDVTSNLAVNATGSIVDISSNVALNSIDLSLKVGVFVVEAYALSKAYGAIVQMLNGQSVDFSQLLNSVHADITNVGSILHDPGGTTMQVLHHMNNLNIDDLLKGGHFNFNNVDVNNALNNFRNGINNVLEM